MTRNRITEGDFRGFAGPTPCAPAAPGLECASCRRHQPAVANQHDRRTLAIDASTLRRDGERCRMFA